MSDTLSKDDRWAIGQALEILFFAGKTEKQCKAINNLLDLVDRQTYKLHKADGMANEVNILTKENRELTAERDKYRDACERLIGHYGDAQGVWGVARYGLGDEHVQHSIYLPASANYRSMYEYAQDRDKSFIPINGFDFARQVKAELEGIEGV